MKFASLKSQKPDGRPVLVSKNLQLAVDISHVGASLQGLLEQWSDLRPELEGLYAELNNNSLSNAFQFDQSAALSPLPRAYQWADGSAYVNHVELVRKARGAEMPKEFWTDPLMYQGGSDDFLGPHQDIEVADESWGIDFEAEIAVITHDVSIASDAKSCKDSMSLFMLVNDVSLRNLIPQELAKGFGFFHSKPSSAFSPVAVTADELHDAWDGERLHLPLISKLNNELFGEPNAGDDMVFSFPQLIAHAAKTRNLRCGTIIGSGTVSNIDRSRGSSCLAEKRMLEKIEQGEIKTPFMKYGDNIKIEMLNAEGQSIFGTIDQNVVPAV
ncbi:MAG: 2-keto-4-pentenoate hydratase [Moraxellaceae bacterium]|nr:MAG: 2-keto-4-pentenoate hydratase [Moraxellaceae bacterium]